MKKEELMEHLDYDPVTGEFKHSLRSKGGKNRGLPMSRRTTNGVVQIKLGDVKSGQWFVSANRLAWLWVHGELPEFRLRNVNGDKHDSRIDNIARVASAGGELTDQLLRENYIYRDGELIRHNGKRLSRSVSGVGYRMAMINGKQLYLHRLIWQWHYGLAGVNRISFNDGNRLNTRIENLSASYENVSFL